MRAIEKIIIHCSDSEYGNVMRIDKWHKERGFDMVGYHYVITNGYDYKGHYLDAKDGAIESGRGVSQIGAHAKGNNSDSIGICLIGAGHYTDAQRLSVKRLVSDLMVLYGVKKENVLGHRELKGVKKSCPTGFNMDEFRGEL